MALILIAYASRHGHTAKVAERLADDWRCAQHEVLLANVAHGRMDPLVAAASAIVVAAPVHYSRHPRRIENFVRRHLGGLHAAPSALVSVCGALAGQWAEGPAEARRYVDALLELTRWRPRMVLSVAGALPYREYGFMTRWFMRRVSAWTGRPTDTSRNYEFTNWSDVDRFAVEFQSLLEPQGAAGAAAPGESASPDVIPEMRCPPVLR